jgi:signal transduction histidine kinase
MSSYKRVVLILIIIEALIILIFNLIFGETASSENRYYRVDAERVVRELEADPELRRSPESMDLAAYSSILRVSRFDADEVCNNDYVVEKVEGTEYRIEYRVEHSNKPVILMNLGLAVFFVITIFVFIYVGRKVIKPFNQISNMTVDLAKGNLTNPVKEEKSRFLGKFLWGVDMLREKLEDSKTKNLKYQKEKKTLLLSLSHDIKTPLSAIQLYTKALAGGIYNTEEEREAAYTGILTKTKEISNYVDEIHRISREEFMEFNIDVGEYYMFDAIKVIEVYYKDKLSVIHTPFTIEPHENCLLKVDRDRLVEAIQNLMENAIKYGDGKGISISFADEEDCKLITVTNTGCTLDKSEMASIFDSFYRGSNTDNIGGNGLGLYIVKQLMTKMGGDAFAEIDGDTFKATLVCPMA